MKVLIISAEVWQDKTNGGNVLTNMFRNMDWELAQIYCNPGNPENNLCSKYYQMTDSMVIKNILNHKPIGRALNYVSDFTKSNSNKVIAEQPNKSFYEFFHKHRLSLFYSIKHLLWNISNWKNDSLKAFIDDFDPDIIFAPCYGDRFMLRLTRFIGDYTGKKIISFISDDCYTLKKVSFSPFFWIERFIVRTELRKTFPYYSLVYTMTELQKKQCEHDLKGNMKILRKSSSFINSVEKKYVNEPIKIVYAGGIYLNRWKTLKMLVDSIREINKDYVRVILDIYTANEITKRIDNALNDGINCSIHKAISQTELEQVYKNSDVALHVESFDLKNRLLVRMSFSTKIVDCLSSGCAVMAICDPKQGGYLYLKNENAAICASSPKEIKDVLSEMVENKNMILKYIHSANECCKRNHNVKRIEEMIKNDFESFCVS